MHEGNFIPFLTAIVNKKAYEEVGGFSSDYKFAPDYYLSISIAEKYIVKAVKKRIAVYRLHPGNLTKKMRDIAFYEEIKMLSSFVNKYPTIQKRITMLKFIHFFKKYTPPPLFSFIRNYFFLNKKKIHVSKVKNLRKSLLATGFAYNVKRARKNNVDNFVKFMKSAQAVRRAGAAALDLCYVACGRLDGFWELFLKPWDTAAGLLIIEEAGGKVTRFDGTRYSVSDKETLASNSKIHSQMVANLV